MTSANQDVWKLPSTDLENSKPQWTILWKSARYILRATAFSHQPVLYCSCYCFCMVNLTRHWHAHCMYFNHSHFTFSQLAPKPPQPQVSNAAQQPRLIVPALPSSIQQITGTGATGNIQFPHGVISGGVVYLPQVWELSTRCTCRSQTFIMSAYHMEMLVKNFCQMVLAFFGGTKKRNGIELYHLQNTGKFFAFSRHEAWHE